MRLLFVGDVVGKPGRALVARHLPAIRSRYDLVIANAENSAGGFGINADSFAALERAGVDVMTLGNHTWDNREVFSLLDEPKLLRPLNYPPATPGRGWATYRVLDEPLTVVNLMGRIFMDPLDDPFAIMDALLERPDLGAVLVDFHAEATSEKAALARHLDGRVAAIVGTHTHVATADTRILPGGTAFQTDVGMTGPAESVIGMDAAGPVGRFVTRMPHRFAVAAGPVELNAVELDLEGGRVTRIARYRYHETLGETREGEVRRARA